MNQFVCMFCLSASLSVGLVVIAKRLCDLRSSVESLRMRVACSEEAFIRLRNKIDNKDHKATNREKFKEVFGIDLVFPDLIGIKYDLDGCRYSEVIKADTWLDREYKDPTGRVSAEKINGCDISMGRIKFL